MKKSIGKIIHDKVLGSKYSIDEFAEKIGMSKSGLYTIFARESISTDQLAELGELLDYDFFIHLLKKETINRIKLKNRVTAAKILIELNLSEEDVEELDLTGKIVKGAGTITGQSIEKE